ncbi:MAG: tetratricopeptide repeat protein [Bdellovibrionales bacterium]|nr:tetratricopeptide repeat protein [Bdellovibrionales bacterium]
MASKLPIVRQSSISGQLASVTLLLCCFMLGAIIFPDKRLGAIVGAFVYLTYSRSAKYFIAHHHRLGMSLLQRKNFEAAIKEFESSYEFFTERPWIDKYRSLVLVSPSRISYREMALVNIAFCYGQLRRQDKAKEFYKRTLAEFPGSQIALAGLTLLNFDEEFGES